MEINNWFKKNHLTFDENITAYTLNNSTLFNKRWQRFIAMYFPNAIVRKKFWQLTCVEIGEGSFLNPNVTVVDDYNSGECLLAIGNNCSIAPGVVFAAHSSHNNSKILRTEGLLKDLEKREKIIIGDDVWVGANATIGAGVTIGRCSIIGANTYVNKNIPDYSLAYGVPVKIIKDLRSLV
ncbi:MAG: acyltransferase [Bacteroidia bacterium]